MNIGHANLVIIAQIGTLWHAEIYRKSGSVRIVVVSYYIKKLA